MRKPKAVKDGYEALDRQQDNYLTFRLILALDTLITILSMKVITVIWFLHAVEPSFAT